MSSRRPFLWVALSLVVALLLFCAWVMGRLYTPGYEAEAVIHLMPNRLSSAHPSGYEGYFEDQMVHLKNREFMGRVSSRLALEHDSNSGREKTVNTLLERVSIVRIPRAKEILSIRCIDPIKDDSMAIVRAVVEEYQQFHDSLFDAKSTEEMDELQRKTEPQLQKINAIKAKLVGEGRSSSEELGKEMDFLYSLCGLSDSMRCIYTGGPVSLISAPSIRSSGFWRRLWEDFQDLYHRALP